MFVYQEEWQKRLLKRYGNELVVLDAIYRTHYALPLFFMTVKTNGRKYHRNTENHKTMESKISTIIFHDRLLQRRNKFY